MSSPSRPSVVWLLALVCLTSACRAVVLHITNPVDFARALALPNATLSIEEHLDMIAANVTLPAIAGYVAVWGNCSTPPPAEATQYAPSAYIRTGMCALRLRQDSAGFAMITINPGASLVLSNLAVHAQAVQYMINGYDDTVVIVDSILQADVPRQYLLSLAAPSTLIDSALVSPGSPVGQFVQDDLGQLFIGGSKAPTVIQGCTLANTTMLIFPGSPPGPILLRNNTLLGQGAQIGAYSSLVNVSRGCEGCINFYADTTPVFTNQSFTVQPAADAPTALFYPSGPAAAWLESLVKLGVPSVDKALTFLDPPPPPPPPSSPPPATPPPPAAVAAQLSASGGGGSDGLSGGAIAGIVIGAVFGSLLICCLALLLLLRRRRARVAKAAAAPGDAAKALAGVTVVAPRDDEFMRIANEAITLGKHTQVSLTPFYDVVQRAGGTMQESSLVTSAAATNRSAPSDGSPWTSLQAPGWSTGPTAGKEKGDTAAGGAVIIGDAMALVIAQVARVEARPDYPIYGGYELLPNLRLRVGGQGAVKFAHKAGSEDFYAVKLFASRDVFEREREFYQNPELRSILPKLEALGDNADGRWADPTGRPLPPYLIMEKGDALHDTASKRNLDVFSCMQIICHVTKAVMDLHAADYVHRDLKPSNVLWLPSQNRWTTIDFGSAARHGERTGLSLTLAYAAPEVARSFEAEEMVVVVDRAVDAWAVGVMAFELLTGSRIFPPGATKTEILDALLGRTQLPWEREGPERDASVAKLAATADGVLSLLRRDPAARAHLPDVYRQWTALFLPAEDPGGAAAAARN